MKLVKHLLLSFLIIISIAIRISADDKIFGEVYEFNIYPTGARLSINENVIKAWGYIEKRYISIAIFDKLNVTNDESHLLLSANYAPVIMFGLIAHGLEDTNSKKSSLGKIAYYGLCMPVLYGQVLTNSKLHFGKSYKSTFFIGQNTDFFYRIYTESVIGLNFYIKNKGVSIELRKPWIKDLIKDTNYDYMTGINVYFNRII